MRGIAARGLTAKFIVGVKPTEKMSTYRDSVEGLELYVTPGGTKTFSFRYTIADGARRRLNLGRWPAKTLEAARLDSRRLMNAVVEGSAPVSERRRERNRQATKPVKTVDDLLEALIAASLATGARESTLKFWTWLARKHVSPRLGSYRVEDLGAGTIRKAVRDIGAAAGPTTGNRAFGLLRRAFNFGLEEEHVSASPVARMKAPFDESTRTRVLSHDELRNVWRVAKQTKERSRNGKKARNDLDVSRSMAIAVQLCLVTAQRAGEIAGMRYSELNLKGRLWVIPALRTKAAREHVLPLSDMAVELIGEAMELAKTRLGRELSGVDPVFPTSRISALQRAEDGAVIGSPNSVARLSLGRAMARLCAAASVGDATAHDLRRTAATAMASEPIRALGEVVTRVLNHAPPGAAVTLIYNRHGYLAEKRAALSAWAELLAEIVGPT